MNIAAAVLYFGAFLPYIWAIVHHQTVPSPVSWAIWAVIDTIVLLAMRKEEVPRGQSTGAAIGAWTVTILAIVLGKMTWGTIDWVAVVGAAAAIMLWRRTGKPLTAIICSE